MAGGNLCEETKSNHLGTRYTAMKYCAICGYDVDMRFGSVSIDCRARTI